MCSSLCQQSVCVQLRAVACSINALTIVICTSLRLWHCTHTIKLAFALARNVDYDDKGMLQVEANFLVVNHGSRRVTIFIVQATDQLIEGWNSLKEKEDWGNGREGK